MHPEVRQKGPGACPICGMALEPVGRRTVEKRNPELEDMTRRFWVSLALTAPILAFMIAEFLPGRPLERWCRTAVATGSSRHSRRRSCCGADGRSSSAAGPRSSTAHLNMFTLIALGVGAAYVYSVAATLAPGLFPASFRMGNEVAVYFEPAAVIVVLVLLGQVLELRARSRTSAAHSQAAGTGAEDRAAARRRWHRARRAARARRRRRPPARPARANRIPVDGVVLEGTTTRRRVDGDRRADPGRRRRRRSPVTGGTVNGTGTFVMRAERVGARYAARADRSDGQRSAAIARADSAARRHGVGAGSCRS